MSALNRYDNIHYNSEFIKATMNHDSAKANKITDDHINELRTIHKQINERIEQIEEKSFSRTITKRTYWISAIGAAAAIAGAFISWFKT